ncbi:hypothetical protein ACJX0J_030774, partial [Zea mays]
TPFGVAFTTSYATCADMISIGMKNMDLVCFSFFFGVSASDYIPKNLSKGRIPFRQLDKEGSEVEMAWL